MKQKDIIIGGVCRWVAIRLFLCIYKCGASLVGGGGILAGEGGRDVKVRQCSVGSLC